MRSGDLIYVDGEAVTKATMRTFFISLVCERIQFQFWFNVIDELLRVTINMKYNLTVADVDNVSANDEKNGEK